MKRKLGDEYEYWGGRDNAPVPSTALKEDTQKMCDRCIDWAVHHGTQQMRFNL